jgi:hypothetical protein
MNAVWALKRKGTACCHWQCYLLCTEPCCCKQAALGHNYAWQRSH